MNLSATDVGCPPPARQWPSPGGSRRRLLWTKTSPGFLKAAATRTAATHNDTRAEPVTVLTRAPQRPFTWKDYVPMMYQVDLAVMMAAVGAAILAAVYLWSKDPDRRRRAWRLLKLLLGR
jgi:hypothetical protein